MQKNPQRRLAAALIVVIKLFKREKYVCKKLRSCT
jgi:hypothetical protein